MFIVPLSELSASNITPLKEVAETKKMKLLNHLVIF